MQIIPHSSLNALAGANRAQTQAAKGDAEAQLNISADRAAASPAGHVDGPETLAAGSESGDRDADGRRAYEASENKKNEGHTTTHPSATRLPPSLDGLGSVIDLQG